MKANVVWDVPTRILHWCIAAGFLLSLLLAYFGPRTDGGFPLHGLAGLVAGGAALLLPLWCYVRSRLCDHGSGPGSRFHRRLPLGSGAGPLARLLALGALLSVPAVAVAGVLAWRGVETAARVHPLLSTLALVALGGHLVEVGLRSRRTGVNLTRSMVTGESGASAMNEKERSL